MKDSICYIVGAGVFTGMPLLPQKDDYIIAADGGYTYIQAYGLKANLLMGDFDSLETLPEDVEILRHPVEKDDTDTMLAVQKGLELGYKTFVIYGGLGGRLDHTLANLQTLAWLSKQGARGYLVGEGLAITAITNGGMKLGPQNQGVISVFCSGETAEGVTLKGLHYPLENATLTSDMPLGVSNEFTGCESLISVEKGTLLVLWPENNFKLPEVF
ncbi:MAG: thiamine diphosphokinase [Firmicutes bacterium]|nr:thiamine diphosphokinase [Bacillota bacterium]